MMCVLPITEALRQASSARQDALAQSHPKQIFVEPPSANASRMGVNVIQTSVEAVRQGVVDACEYMRTLLIVI